MGKTTEKIFVLITTLHLEFCQLKKKKNDPYSSNI